MFSWVSWDTIKDQYFFWRQRKKFRKCHGLDFDLENPRSYSEKIIWRKVFDRNSLFPLLADKYRSREYVVEKIGRQRGGKILVPLLFVTERPEEIPFSDLPEEYIIKPNHGSGWSIIVDKDDPARPKEIVSKCRKWLRTTYGRSRMEWAYSEIRPLILIEMLLKDRKGKLPTDWKFEVLNGRVGIVYLLHDRFGSPSEAIYDRDFNRLWVCAFHKDALDIERPEAFEEMVDIAEELASGIDFLRVDLYNVDGRIFFGEFTLYPASGLYRYEPVSFDLALGEKWRLEKTYARQFKPWF
ncbi:MAG TPA: ATP-grasp fold amidoligase family protein [Synergistales bacterium]|jgi:hypothetical protein|nr:ATP-grasp fold amidoligase family protein [Synergistales bacterium]MDD5515788.1 ATP-grasp fold amidoligase family protein [Synergistales bacterium]MDI9392672.1 ATP-grasp fold amidoligase family protein [Synergistota bacterium]HOI81962.1 ATP-grasp fold amidoligase family protein [Synergistales bacterium]